jgi:hypothetical protein
MPPSTWPRAARSALAAITAASGAYGCFSVSYVDDEPTRSVGGGALDGGSVDAAADADASPADACVPRTCFQAIAQCGEVDDLCGGKAACPACPKGQACGKKAPNTCADACWPATCADANAECGAMTDGCGAKHDCGPCAPGKGACVANHCACQAHEICGNGIDDDCNGKVDEDCTRSCQDAPGAGNCNTDQGKGDHCDAASNTHGCDDYWFYGWCHRAQDAAGYQSWVDAMQKWVGDHCDGEVVRTDGKMIVFDCTASDGVHYTCDTPIVLVRAGASIAFRAGPADAFDLTGRGVCRDSDWPTPETPWLAMDRDHDGRIGDGAELFGSATPLARGGVARDGFEALRELDADGDGAITPRDPAFADLVVWTDRDGDRRSTPDELEPAGAWGVASIALAFVVDPTCDARGNCARERARLSYRDARGAIEEGEVVDVHLAAR